MNPPIIAVDFDGTLTKETCWNAEDVTKATPNEKICEWVRKKYLDSFIIIYTARRDDLTEVSIQWLRKHNVPFHAYSNNKIPADYYLDDHAVNIKDYEEI
jgi:uncharacterized HAD superfamily protein